MKIPIAATCMLLLGAASCALFEESPEAAARRIEAQRQASLPVSQAGCAELERCAKKAERAINDELKEQQLADNMEQAMKMGRNDPLPPALLRQPQSMVREYALIQVVTTEMAQRCGV